MLFRLPDIKVHNIILPVYTRNLNLTLRKFSNILDDDWMDISFNLQGWLYPINIHELDIKNKQINNKYSRYYDSNRTETVIVNLPIGYVDFNTSREVIDMTRKSIKFIRYIKYLLTSDEYLSKMDKVFGEIDVNEVIENTLDEGRWINNRICCEYSTDEYGKPTETKTTYLAKFKNFDKLNDEPQTNIVSFSYSDFGSFIRENEWLLTYQTIKGVSTIIDTSKYKRGINRATFDKAITLLGISKKDVVATNINRFTGLNILKDKKIIKLETILDKKVNNPSKPLNPNRDKTDKYINGLRKFNKSNTIAIIDYGIADEPTISKITTPNRSSSSMCKFAYNVISALHRDACMIEIPHGFFRDFGVDCIKRISNELKDFNKVIVISNSGMPNRCFLPFMSKENTVTVQPNNTSSARLVSMDKTIVEGYVNKILNNPDNLLDNYLTTLKYLCGASVITIYNKINDPMYQVSPGVAKTYFFNEVCKKIFKKDPSKYKYDKQNKIWMEEFVKAYAMAFIMSIVDNDIARKVLFLKYNSYQLPEYIDLRTPRTFDKAGVLDYIDSIVDGFVNFYL